MTQHSTKHKTIRVLLCFGLMSTACHRKYQGDGPLKRSAPATTASAETKAQPAQPENQGEARLPCAAGTQLAVSGALAGNILQEVSGLVSSSRSPGLLWVHNDSGDGANLYALDEKGQHLGTAELPVPARDWEDIALEPRKNGSDRLYVADTGDNLSLRRDGVTIFRIDEPSRDQIVAAHPKALRVDAPEIMRLKYPSGPQDAEALLVDPENGELVLITKPRLGVPQIYSTPRFQDEAILRHEGALAAKATQHLIHMVTGADISRSGRWILVRTYVSVELFYRAPGTRIVEALSHTPCSLTAPNELQGEAIGFLIAPGHDNDTKVPPPFLTVSEGMGAPLHRFTFLHPNSSPPSPPEGATKDPTP